MNKRGISPVIATVLLIGIVIAVAAIIFLWIRELTPESITKFGKNVELVCADVQLSASFDSVLGILYVTNDGNIPIVNFKILEVNADGSYNEKDGSPLDAGESLDKPLGETDLSKIIIIPILNGTNEKGQESNYTCGENYGTEVNL